MRAEPGSQASQPHNCPRRKPEQIPLGRPWILHARVGGSSRAYVGQALNLGFTPDDSKAAVERNRAAFSPRTHRRQPSLAANQSAWGVIGRRPSSRFGTLRTPIRFPSDLYPCGGLGSTKSHTIPRVFYGYPYEMVIHGFSALLRIRMFGSPIFTASCLILVIPRNSS
jgi:hypothetical protein